MSNFPPSVPLTRLYERVSKRGNHYLVGRLGLAKITVLKTSELDNDGNSVWTLLAAEAPPRSDATAGDTEPSASGQESNDDAGA